MSMSNLAYWDRFREVPETAKKPIRGGRLNGKTDINPVWRLKALTEIYGPVGIGWRYEITGKEMKEGANGEVAAFVDINLYYKLGEQWSEPIPGTGGSMFVAKEKNGPYTSDECYKMALTDAISVACKALGVGADVYWSGDSSKYDKHENVPVESSKTTGLTKSQLEEFGKLCEQEGGEAKTRLKKYVESMGYAKLSLVPQERFEELKDTFLSAGLPFSL